MLWPSRKAATENSIGMVGLSPGWMFMYGFGECEPGTSKTWRPLVKTSSTTAPSTTRGR